MNAFPQDAATILVVDSDPLMLTAVAAVLNMSGYECHCASDAEAALKACRGLSLDLIICDLDIDSDGTELGRELRQQPQCEDLPFIFVSSAPASDNVQRTRDAGGEYFLRKPYDPDVLLELVDKTLWMPHLVNTRLERGGQTMLRPATPAFADERLAVGD